MGDANAADGGFAAGAGPAGPAIGAQVFAVAAGFAAGEAEVRFPGTERRSQIADSPEKDGAERPQQRGGLPGRKGV